MFCQKCRAPLKLHASLSDQLSPAAFDLLAASSPLIAKVKSTNAGAASNTRLPYPADRREYYDHAVQNSSSSGVFKRVVTNPRFSGPSGGDSQESPMTPGTRSIYHQNPADSFVYLTESQVATAGQPFLPNGSRRNGDTANPSQSDRTNSNNDERNTLSHQLKVSSRLFDVLSSKSDIDHPICMECTELLIDGLGKRLANATRERDAYVEFVKRVNAEIPSEDEKAAAHREYEAVRLQEAAALESVQQMEAERLGVLEELKQLEEEARQLDLEEEKFWRDRNEFALQLEEFQNERDGINLQYDHDSRQLERLQRTNVYNDTFCIGHDGYFGTINGLRLGRLPHQQVHPFF